MTQPWVLSENVPESISKLLFSPPHKQISEQVSSYFDTLKDGGALIINSFVYSDSSFLGISRLAKYQKKQLNVDAIERELNLIIKEYNRSGYPFFRITLKPTFISADSFDIYVNTENYSQRVLIDTIVLPMGCKVSKNFICGYINVHEGDVFDIWQLEKSQQRIERMRFLEMNTPIQARFSSGGAILEIPLVAKLSGSITGIIGITKSSTNNKTILIGDFQFALQNAFKQGESVNFNWKRPSIQSQILEMFAEYPYIAGSQYGITGNIDLQKRDTSFAIMRNSLYGVLYKQWLKISLGVDFFSVNTLSIAGQSRNSSRFLYSGKILYYHDGKRPRSGENCEVKFSVGKRTLPDSLRQQSMIFESTIYAEQSLPLNEILGVKTNTSLGTILTRQKINPEELITIGGLSTLRGFDEKSLFVRHWLYSTFELHWFYESQSSFFPYLQLGRYFLGVFENIVPKNFYSFGLGADMTLGSGKLMVIWANGTNWGEKLYLGKSKLHVGYRIQF